HVMDSRTEYHTVAELDVINSTTSVHSLNHPATSEIYTLSLHDALPIAVACRGDRVPRSLPQTCPSAAHADTIAMPADHPRQSSLLPHHQRRRRAEPLSCAALDRQRRVQGRRAFPGSEKRRTRHSYQSSTLRRRNRRLSRLSG